jgi:hypothetical protein
MLMAVTRTMAMDSWGRAGAGSLSQGAGPRTIIIDPPIITRRQHPTFNL